jgi:hypothetical protein
MVVKRVYHIREEHRLRMFKNKVLKGLKLVHAELHNLYSSSNITMRWARHKAHMKKYEMPTKFWLESLRGRNHSGRPRHGLGA